VACQVCRSVLRAGDLYCSSCGAVVPEHTSAPRVAEVRDRIAGERKYLTVLCADLQRSTDLISELDPEAAISRLEPALVAMRTAVRRNRGIQGAPAAPDAIAKFERTIEIAARLEAGPLLGAPKGTLAHLLADSGKKIEAQEELVQAIALFARSKMTIQLERAKAALSKSSDL